MKKHLQNISCLEQHTLPASCWETVASFCLRKCTSILVYSTYLPQEKKTCVQPYALVSLLKVQNGQLPEVDPSLGMDARQSRGCRWRAWRGAQRRAARQLRSCPSSGWDGSASRVPVLLRVPSSDPGSASAQPCSTSHLLESRPRCLPT